MTLERVMGKVWRMWKADEGVDKKTLYDPHTWLDPEKKRRRGDIDCQAFIREVDPKHRDVYKRTPRPFEKAHEITQKYQVYLLKPVKRPFVTRHTTAFSYLAKRFWAQAVGDRRDLSEQEPSPKRLSEFKFVQDL